MITNRLTNRQKAALLLLSLDVETATKMMRTLSQQEIEDLTVEIANLKGVAAHSIDNVVAEFQQLISAQEFTIQGGTEQAQKLLEKSVGPSRATGILEKIKSKTGGRGFEVLKKADPGQLAGFLQKEHPQTIAFVLSNLTADQSASVLSHFSDVLRNDVSFRMATLGQVSPALLAEVENLLELLAKSEITQGLTKVAGTKSLAGVLNKVNTESARSILEHIEQKEPDVADEIKRLMFLFEDIIQVDDKGIQRLLRELDKKDLAMSLKVADEKLKEKIFANMSERARDLLKEELQYMGPVRLKEVEAAQGRVVATVRRLEEQGEIIIAGRGGAEEVIV